MSVIHSNPLKMPVIEIQEGLPYFFINNATNLIQYRGTVGMFNTRCFASNCLNYSYFSDLCFHTPHLALSYYYQAKW